MFVSRQQIAWLTAATLLACAALWIEFDAPRRQRYAVINQIRRSVASTEDREFQVTLSFDAPAEAADHEIKLQLFVRGDEAFVVHAPAGWKQAETRFGRDRNGAWFEPAAGPALTGPAALAMQRRFLCNSAEEAPFLQMAIIIDRLADHYDIRQLPTEVPFRGALAPVFTCQFVRGTLRPPNPATVPIWFPDQIDIHADQETGAVRRLMLVWNHETPLHLSQVQFDFIQQSRKPDGWYRGVGSGSRG